MKKYSFRFESLLNIRGLQQEQAERDFREAVIAYGEEVEKLENLRREVANLLDEMTEMRKANTEIKIQLLFMDYVKVVNKRIEKQILEVKLAEEKVEKQREILVEAIREKKIVEKLKVKDYDKYLVELRRWEQKVMDDLSTLRHGNKELLSSQI